MYYIMSQKYKSLLILRFDLLRIFSVGNWHEKFEIFIGFSENFSNLENLFEVISCYTPQ